MITYSRYSVESILPLIGKGKIHFDAGNNTLIVDMNSHRMECFNRSICCAACGIKGNIFLLQRHSYRANKLKINCFLDNCPRCQWDYLNIAGESHNKAHFNLYHIDRGNNLVLMIAHHIIPLSEGGNDSIENLQTFCHRCNQFANNASHRQTAASMIEARAKKNAAKENQNVEPNAG